VWPVSSRVSSESFVYVLQVCWLTLCTALVGYVKDGEFKQKLNKYVSVVCFGILSNAISSVITYHNEENKPKSGICVANHTSPIDVLILMCDNCYSLVCRRLIYWMSLHVYCLVKPLLAMV
jgi:glycerol-3-phosphate O-acyltransferase 3/4